MCSLRGFFHGAAGRLLAALGLAHSGTRGAPGCVAERLRPWTPDGDKLQVHGGGPVWVRSGGSQGKGSTRTFLLLPTNLTQIAP